MPDSPPRSRQEATIQQQWPRTAKQLHATYFTAEDWAITDRVGHNAAGYMLWALSRIEAKIQTEFAHRNYDRDEIDLAASREVYYQWTHARQFRNASCALSTCLMNLAIERPEKLMEARNLLAGRRGAPATSTARRESGQSTVTPSSYPTGTPRSATAHPTESGSRTSTHLRCSPDQSQGQMQLSYTSNLSWQPAHCESSQPTLGQIATVA